MGAASPSTLTSTWNAICAGGRQPGRARLELEHALELVLALRRVARGAQRHLDHELML